MTRRGVFLILFGALYGVIGYSYLAPLDPLSLAAVQRSLRVVLQWAPLHVYGWCWVVVGGLTAIGGLIRRLDWLGFAAAVTMPTAWAMVYFAAWRLGDNPRGYLTSALFALIAAAVSVVAGMPEPRDIRELQRRP